jgi:hypothetical protein
MSKGFLNLQGMPAAAMGRGEAGRVTQRWDTYEEVRAEMDRLGFRELHPPGKAIPTVKASELENVQSPAYSQKYTELVGWLSFGESMRGSLTAELLETRNALKALAAEIRRKAKEVPAGSPRKALAPAELTDLVVSDSEYQRIMIRDQRLTQKLHILEGSLKGISRAAQLMSRNIERVKLEYEAQSNRAGRAGFGAVPVLGRRPEKAKDVSFDSSFGGPEENYEENEEESP